MTYTSTIDPTCPPSPAYIGWRRVPTGKDRGKWEPVVSGATDHEAGDRLVRLVGTTGYCDAAVLPAGEDPL